MSIYQKSGFLSFANKVNSVLLIKKEGIDLNILRDGKCTSEKMIMSFINKTTFPCGRW